MTDDGCLYILTLSVPHSSAHHFINSSIHQLISYPLSLIQLATCYLLLVTCYLSLATNNSLSNLRKKNVILTNKSVKIIFLSSKKIV